MIEQTVRPEISKDGGFRDLYLLLLWTLNKAL